MLMQEVPTTCDCVDSLKTARTLQAEPTGTRYHSVKTLQPLPPPLLMPYHDLEEPDLRQHLAKPAATTNQEDLAQLPSQPFLRQPLEAYVITGPGVDRNDRPYRHPKNAITATQNLEPRPQETVSTGRGVVGGVGRVRGAGGRG